MEKPLKTTLPQLPDGLAPYACGPRTSRGRLYQEPEDPTRNPYQRDRDRIVHSMAFRRLEYKTQVFVNHEGDHYRTRLTHSLEVAQLARSMSRSLRVNEDLAEALALAHDLGHTPFGHAGEDALRETMKEFGGFDHNGQTLRILTKLEHRYALFDGLNLTWETLEGVAKHNGPVTAASYGSKGLKKPPEGRKKGRALLTPLPAEAGLPRAIAEYNALHDLELHTYAGAEAQIASLADDIAYNNHDIDDGLRSGLFTLGEIESVPLVGRMFNEVRKLHPGLEEQRLIHEVIRRLIHAMVIDVLTETSERIIRHRVAAPEDVRAMARPLVAFSDGMETHIRKLKNFLKKHMYRHWRVNRMTSKARRVVKELFAFFLEEPECLPPEWQKLAGKPGSKQTAEVVADFIAGMTDRFAIQEHERVFDPRQKT
jgi:dGTPase